MSSRGLYIFFRTQNRVVYRKTRYCLTAINFEAALYYWDDDDASDTEHFPSRLSAGLGPWVWLE